MDIAIIGTGYVGVVTGTCLADLGHNVTFVDIDINKINTIQKGTSPVFEPGLSELLQKNGGRIAATLDLSEAMKSADLTVITVGTPSRQDGSLDLTYVTSAARDIGTALKQKNGFHTVVIKSTVLPGTAEDIVKPILEERSGKSSGTDFGLASNPEFLREGSAVYDFFHADRIIIGADDPKSRDLLESLYHTFNCPKMVTTIRTAEMIKYASNAFLATKISFANEIGNLCKILKIDTDDVFQGVGMDTRIGPAFFRSGIGFGGSCFPKDVRAFIAMAREKGVKTEILNAVMAVNDRQPVILVNLLRKHLSLPGNTIGILGLAFKPDTDDIRESRAIPVINSLLLEGCRIIAYDPKATDEFRKIFPHITYARNPEELLHDSDAVIIITEWDVFKTLDYTGKIVIDGRHLEKPRHEARIYEGVCW